MHVFIFLHACTRVQINAIQNWSLLLIEIDSELSILNISSMGPEGYTEKIVFVC